MKKLVNSKTVPDRGDRYREKTGLGWHFRGRIFSAGRQKGRREVREGLVGGVVVLDEDATALVEQPRRARPFKIDRPQLGSETSRGWRGTCQTGSSVGRFGGWSGIYNFKSTFGSEVFTNVFLNYALLQNTKNYHSVEPQSIMLKENWDCNVSSCLRHYLCSFYSDHKNHNCKMKLFE